MHVFQIVDFDSTLETVIFKQSPFKQYQFLNIAQMANFTQNVILRHIILVPKTYKNIFIANLR